MAQPSTLDADVIIVGAGLSGMIAARKVLEAGLTPLVLEADERGPHVWTTYGPARTAPIGV